MKHTAVIGTQWGDEGKGKIVDYLASLYNIIVRCQGGNNAGHTVVIDGVRYPFHLLPSAVLRPGVTCVLGNGMVINPFFLVEELNRLESRVSEHARILISDRAHVITPELVREDEEKGKVIGTTGKGIGPTYEAKARRTGIRMLDFLNSGRCPIELKDRLSHMIRDTSVFLCDNMDFNQRILFEGAQATMLDIDHGTYPFVTSSNTTIGGIFSGSGIFTRDIYVLGVAKAYTTRVGNGPFPTELIDDIGEKIRKVGAEFGTTTGRPRRCGWLDLIVLEHSLRINGLDALAVTKLDVLTGINPIKVCSGYLVNEELIKIFPADLNLLQGAIPIYEELPGWTEDITLCRSYSDLPENARGYIDFIDRKIPVRYIGVGPNRDQIIDKPL